MKTKGVPRESSKKNPSQLNIETGVHNNSGNVLLYHTFTRAVPSALEGLTAVFGMGTGVPSSLSPPKTMKIEIRETRPSAIQRKNMAKPHDLLVPVSSMRYHTFTSGLSTS